MGSSLITKFFPVPPFMTLHGSGVYLSPTRLCYLLVNKTPGKLVSWGDVALSESPFGEKKSILKNNKELLGELKKLHENTHSEYVAVSVPEEKSYVYETSVESELTPKKIMQRIETTIEGHVPLAHKDMLFTYDLVHENKKKGKKHLSVSVVERSYVDEALELFHEAELVPTSFDTESRAVVRACIPAHEEKSSIVIHITSERAVVALAYKNVIRYAYSVKGEMGEVSLQQKKATKKEVDEREAGMEVLMEGLGRVLEYHHHNQIEGISDDLHIILCSETGHDDWFIKKFKDLTGFPVRVANPWVNLVDFSSYVPPIHRSEAAHFAVAAGLAANASGISA